MNEKRVITVSILVKKVTIIIFLLKGHHNFTRLDVCPKHSCFSKISFQDKK